MTSGHITLWNRPSLLALITLALSVAFTAPARAACFTSAHGNPLAAARPQFAPLAAVQSDQDEGQGSIVGMWNAEFLIGSGPDVYDQSFQLFHADGTEMMLSRGLPPVLGNVCVGIWKQKGRSITLKHMAWNWNPDGTFAGTFIMEVTLRMSKRGTSYTGTWSADNLDTAGAVIPELHFEGVAKATRITVN